MPVVIFVGAGKKTPHNVNFTLHVKIYLMISNSYGEINAKYTTNIEFILVTFTLYIFLLYIIIKE